MRCCYKSGRGYVKSEFSQAHHSHISAAFYIVLFILGFNPTNHNSNYKYRMSKLSHSKQAFSVKKKQTFGEKKKIKDDIQ